MQAQLKGVNKLLKLDPGNGELMAQKQRLLTQAVGEAREVYFNTRKYHRSRVTERKEKSPLKLMARKKYPEFLEILGY